MNRDEPQMHTSGRQYDRRRRALGGAQSLSAAGPATETGDHPLAGRRPGGTSAAVGNRCPAGLDRQLYHEQSLPDSGYPLLPGRQSDPHAFSVTLYETLTGFVIGAFGGLLLAILLWQSELVSKILEPYLVVLNSLPKIALGPVIIIWVGAGTEAIIVMAVAISMIVTVLEMLEGFRSTDPELIRMAETFGASRHQIFRKIVFPANIPVLFNSLKINIGLSLVGVIAGEFLVSKAGLGYLIVYGGQVFQLDLVMTGVIILALMAVGMYRCITLVENRVLRGRRR